MLEAWHIEVAESKGLVLMFHGYAGSKSRLLPYSGEFNKLGYSTLLVDFRGSGGSSGNETTIGFKEAKDVTKALGLLSGSHPRGKFDSFRPIHGRGFYFESD